MRLDPSPLTGPEAIDEAAKLKQDPESEAVEPIQVLGTTWQVSPDLLGYLLRFAGEAEAEAAADEAVALEQAHGETILVIDDEESVRILINDLLDEAGYRVLTAQDGPSGLAILQSEKRIDLLITDVGLPGGSTAAKWQTPPANGGLS